MPSNQRTAAVNRLRWRLHELDPEIDPSPRSLDRASNYDKLSGRIETFTGCVARLARLDIDECRRLTIAIDELEKEIGVLIEQQAPTLLTIPGCGILTAAKIVGETGGIQRFKSSAAFARHTGTAPLPVWSSNHQRHRLSRVGNRQLNAALHRIAVTQIRVHKPAKTLFERRKAGGDGGLEALRVLKRHLANTIYKTLIADTQK